MRRRETPNRKSNEMIETSLSIYIYTTLYLLIHTYLLSIHIENRHKGQERAPLYSTSLFTITTSLHTPLHTNLLLEFLGLFLHSSDSQIKIDKLNQEKDSLLQSFSLGTPIPMSLYYICKVDTGLCFSAFFFPEIRNPYPYMQSIHLYLSLHSTMKHATMSTYVDVDGHYHMYLYHDNFWFPNS